MATPKIRPALSLESTVHGREISAVRKILRGYLAGFLTTREEIAALYSLNLNKGITQAGNIILEITPKDAPDAYGAWWVCSTTGKIWIGSG